MISWSYPKVLQICAKVQTKYIIIIVIVLSVSAELVFDAGTSKKINVQEALLGILNKWSIDYNSLLNKWMQDLQTPKTAIVPSVEAAADTDNNGSKIAGGQVDADG